MNNECNKLGYLITQDVIDKYYKGSKQTQPDPSKDPQEDPLPEQLPSQEGYESSQRGPETKAGTETIVQTTEP
ncbi:hypothetical protein C1645_824255 [Glomus cerebriforme]|uniref:Uncharacterized protein n=1 Tax=Glomus cerebriforme TaxID=658196 RepID=A0A397SUD9_9GLOM|nr:hypothetical protein C1645_824255 [Glomus cerebriforme]